MSDLKKWVYELVLCTIVAGGITLLFWVLRLDRTWNDVFQTFFTAFVVMTALGIWHNLRHNSNNKT